MTEDTPVRRLTEVHIAGWTIVRVAGDLDAAGSAELRTRAAAAPVAGARLAIDLQSAPLDPSEGLDVLRELVATASGVGARLVTIVADGQGRERLRAAGVTEVYESLDEALEVTTPILREAGAPPPPAHLAPASGDAQLVATEDATGRGEAAR